MASFGFNESFGSATFVDINQIPISIIDRVEVLLDGASAIYGSDAVAGSRHDPTPQLPRAEVAGLSTMSTHARWNQCRGRALTLAWVIWSPGPATDLLASYSHLDQDAVKTTSRSALRKSVRLPPFGLPDFRQHLRLSGNLNRQRPDLPASSPGGSRRHRLEPGSPGPGQCLLDRSGDLVAEWSRMRPSSSLARRPAAPLRAVRADADDGRTVVHGQNRNFSGSSYLPPERTSLPARPLPPPVGHPQNPVFRSKWRCRPGPGRATRVLADERHPTVVAGVATLIFLAATSRARCSGPTRRRGSTTQGVVDDARPPQRAVSTPAAGGPGLSLSAIPRRRSGCANGTPLPAPTTWMSERRRWPSVDVRGTREVFQLPGVPLSFTIGGEVPASFLVVDPTRASASGQVERALRSDSARRRPDRESSAYAECRCRSRARSKVSLAGR